jgi:hypothetical protein
MHAVPRFCFTSGSPRSGSTLLNPIPKQNRRFGTGMAGEDHALISKGRRQNVLRVLFVSSVAGDRPDWP